MEITIDTTSDELDLSDAIQQFFDSNAVQTPIKFKQMFISNYQRLNQKFTSDELYQIFKSYGYKTRYRDFCGRFIGILNQIDFKEINNIQNLDIVNPRYRGLKQKKIYEITYKGYQKIMMTIDDNVRDYFIECEYLLVSFFKNYVQSQQLIIKQREEQLQDIKSKSDILFIYEIDMVDRNKRYRGKSLNLQTRIFDHLHKSTNKEVREAVQNNETINIYVLAQMQCQNKDQQAFLEQLFILNLPEEIRSNVVIPFVQKWSNVPQEFQQQARDILANYTRTSFQYIPPRQVRNNQQLINQEEVKEVIIERQTSLNNHYDDIDIEDYKEYIVDDSIDSEFKQKIQQVVEFKQQHNKYPKDNKNSSIQNEYRLAQFMNKLKIAIRNNNDTAKVTKERFAYIKHTIPDFNIKNDLEASFKENVIKLRDFIIQYNRYPNPNEKDNQSELKIATFLGHLRQNYKKDKLSNYRYNFVNQTIPNFTWDVKLCEHTEILQQLQEFYNLHNRTPLQKENKHIQKFVSAVKSKKIILTDELMSKYEQLFN